MILYFTGTGNSRLVANSLADCLGDTAVAIGQPIQGDAKRIVWVFPVYSWGIPPVVCKYMQTAEIPAAEHAIHEMVCTCGDDTGNIQRQWRKLMRKRAWHPGAAYSVQMPNTYTLMKGFDVDSAEVAEKKLAAMNSRVDEIAQLILRGNISDHLVHGRWPGIKSGVIYPWFVRFAMSPKPFQANDACSRCGLCRRQCPMANIAESEDGRPVWGNNCALCLRCYHICPHHAVQYGRATQGKGQYMAPGSVKKLSGIEAD